MKSVTIPTIPTIPCISCHVYLVPPRSQHHQSWLLLTRMIPAEQEPSMGKGPVCYSSCMTFFSEAATQDCTASSCYPFMTAPARLVTDVCNTSSGEINCFTWAQFLLNQQCSFKYGNTESEISASRNTWLGIGPEILMLQATLHGGISEWLKEAAVEWLNF